MKNLVLIALLGLSGCVAYPNAYPVGYARPAPYYGAPAPVYVPGPVVVPPPVIVRPWGGYGWHRW